MKLQETLVLLLFESFSISFSSCFIRLSPAMKTALSCPIKLSKKEEEIENEQNLTSKKEQQQKP